MARDYLRPLFEDRVNTGKRFGDIINRDTDRARLIIQINRTGRRRSSSRHTEL